MNIVFLSTFEQTNSQLETGKAQLTIGEREGVWHLVWILSGEDRKEQEVWYEGLYWEELIASLRYGVVGKMAEGYMPMIDNVLGEERAQTSTWMNQLLFYAESHYDAKLYDELRQWRREQATIENKSAYLISSNKLLRLISCYKPAIDSEIMQIPGWGKTKQGKYGKQVLDIVKTYEREHQFPLDWVAQQLNKVELERWIFKQKKQKYKAAMEWQLKAKQLLELVYQGGTIAVLEEKLQLGRREILELLEQLEQDGYDVEPLIELELNEISSAEQELIWKAIEETGGTYLKPVLIKAFGSDSEQFSSQEAARAYEKIRLIRMRYNRRKEKDVG